MNIRHQDYRYFLKSVSRKKHKIIRYFFNIKILSLRYYYYYFIIKQLVLVTNICQSKIN